MSEGVLIDGMATHDTDPQRAHAAFPSTDDGATQPGGAPTDEGSSAIAESLLADLARAPLPTDNVRETEGHAAAAYAVAPHRPPRANEKTIETAAVVVATTEPGDRPLPLAEETTVPVGTRLVETTPSARTRSSRRILVASIGGAVAAAAIAVAIVVFGSPPPAPTPAPTAAAPTTPASIDALPAPSPAPASSPSTTVSGTASASVTASATTTGSPRTTAKTAPAPRPTPPSSARPPRPSGTFAEPDRSLF